MSFAVIRYTVDAVANDPEFESPTSREAAVGSWLRGYDPAVAAISLAGVSKTFVDGTHAVADLDLDIGDGECLAVVGPSGCGKSTVLRIVAGLETPTSGEVSIGGQVVTDSAPGDRDLAIVFQDYALYPHLNAYQNIAFALKSRRMGRKAIDRLVREVAALLGIESLLHRRSVGSTVSSARRSFM